jgi:AGCS family alanine or glycine:cation symporter
MEKFSDIVSLVNGWVWGPWFLVLLVGTHIFLTFRTGFIQKKIFKAIKLSITKDNDSAGDVSQFGALTTALASTIGTGNIVGVGTAIAAGGPGAVLWMWLTGVFGIATKYSECLISVKYRVRDEKGAMLGGAMYALQRGLNAKWLGVLFAILTAVCAFGIGSGVQANATATILKDNLNTPNWVTGLIIVVLVGAVLIGGIKWIAKVCEKLVPFMAIFYVIGCIILLIMNAKYLGPAVSTIVTDAFSAKAIGGGFLGQGMMAAMRFGVARGLFSNESGMGSAPIVAAAAKTKNPVRQALVSMTGTFWDTVVICLITGLVLTTTIIKNGLTKDNIGDGHITTVAFNDLGVFGSFILIVGIVTFASSTILGWSYYGDRCVDYLLGRKAVIPYRIIYVIVAFLGATLALDIVWNIADTLNALMAIPNIVAVLLLSNVVAKETNHYLTGGNIDLADGVTIPLRTEV